MGNVLTCCISRKSKDNEYVYSHNGGTGEIPISFIDEPSSCEHHDVPHNAPIVIQVAEDREIRSSPRDVSLHHVGENEINYSIVDAIDSKDSHGENTFCLV